MLERYFTKPDTLDRIRACWLGEKIEAYASKLEAHGHAAKITLRMKAEALEACTLERVEPGEPHRNPRWRDDPTLLKWLKSL